MKSIIFFFVNPDQIIQLANNRLKKQVLPNLTDYRVFTPKGGKNFKVGISNSLTNDILCSRNIFVFKDTSPVLSTLNALNVNGESDIAVYSVFHRSAGNFGDLAAAFLTELGDRFKTYLTEDETKGSTYEKYLIPLIENFDDNLFDDLLKRFPDKILAEKLSLLHDCLVPTGAPKTLPLLLLAAPDGEYYKTAYNDFLNIINGKTDDDVFKPDFIDAVKNLRIVFLGS
jgi:hypothetical protein